ncbi:transcription repressor NadR [Fusibacter bizertensis]|jgi:Predicted small molecule binding protein (contains 3H domain)|uniref:Transcription repressor NadR n=1 Tax=Fusibacter bizertensis TaxID=1488331 RepID=A0ABT6NDF5_9FIRM|nr:transcription repressor NadR [Fusibacter bizertensis]MDH8678453.1 transcription repressor NadR [Fusibacter bizertensis]
MSEERRRFIVEKLSTSGTPIIGSELAEMYDVTRQVIVQDIAIIRASGIPVIATSSGYMIQRHLSSNKLIRTFVSKHEGFDRMEEELSIIVEYGGRIIDVIVEHPVYGEIVGTLHIENLEDIESFVHKVKLYDAKPLSVLTKGDHIHTIEVPSEKVFQLIMEELKLKGFVD